MRERWEQIKRSSENGIKEELERTDWAFFQVAKFSGVPKCRKR